MLLTYTVMPIYAVRLLRTRWSDHIAVLQCPAAMDVSQCCCERIWRESWKRFYQPVRMWDPQYLLCVCVPERATHGLCLPVRPHNSTPSNCVCKPWGRRCAQPWDGDQVNHSTLHAASWNAIGLATAWASILRGLA